MHALLVAVLLASAAAPEQGTTSPPRIAVWTQPLTTASLALTGNALSVPLGVSLPLGERTSLAVEVAYLNISLNSHLWGPEPFFGTERRAHRAALIVGPVFSFGPDAFSGLFVQPKLTGVLGVDPPGGSIVDPPNGGRLWEVQAGVDAGYAFRFGPVYLAPIAGVGVGYCHNCIDPSPLRFSSALVPFAGVFNERPRVNRPVLGINLNLLRAGAVF